MSDERFEKLGIPRRKFLKGIIGGAFAAPVVVSFGLDGVAQANTPQFNNQFYDHFPYQHIPNQAQVYEHNPHFYYGDG